MPPHYHHTTASQAHRDMFNSTHMWMSTIARDSNSAMPSPSAAAAAEVKTQQASWHAAPNKSGGTRAASPKGDVTWSSGTWGRNRYLAAKAGLALDDVSSQMSLDRLDSF